MGQLIILAKKYRKRPSEILNIDNDYLAYIFDKLAIHLEDQMTDDKGNVKMDRVDWLDNPKKTNDDYINFVKKHS